MAKRTPTAAPRPAKPRTRATKKGWTPPKGYIVRDGKDYLVTENGVSYHHVSEAPDGRWVYQQVK